MAARRRRVVQRNRLSNAQIEALIAYMEDHTLFARGQIPKLGAQGHIKFKEMWMKLTTQLNLLGPSIKTEKEWQETWKRMRLNAKSKKVQFNTALRRTGHDTPNIIMETKDERISAIFGQYGSGVNLGRELGFPKNIWKEPVHYSTGSGSCLDAGLNNVTNNALAKFEEECFHKFQQIIFIWKGKGKVSSKPNNWQMETLVNYMERHPQLAMGTATNAETLWEIVVTMLNGTPRGTYKPTKGWQKTWSDLVNSARQNLMFLSEGSRLAPLSELHVRVLKIVGYEDEKRSFSRPAANQPRITFSPAMSAKRVRLDPDQPSTSTGGGCNFNTSKPLSSIFPSPSTASSAAATTARPNFEPTLNQISTHNQSAVKSSKFLRALDDSLDRFVDKLADLLRRSFEKQNAVIQQSFQENNEAILEKLPKIISEQFIKALENPSTAVTTSELEARSTVPDLPQEDNDEYLASDMSDDEDLCIDMLLNDEE